MLRKKNVCDNCGIGVKIKQAKTTGEDNRINLHDIIDEVQSRNAKVVSVVLEGTPFGITNIFCGWESYKNVLFMPCYASQTKFIAILTLVKLHNENFSVIQNLLDKFNNYPSLTMIQSALKVFLHSAEESTWRLVYKVMEDIGIYGERILASKANVFVFKIHWCLP